jgi:Tripartite tricarboxylate transporter family receptor
MKLPRRQFLHLAAGAAALPTVPRFARAQAYPARPVRVVVGYPPGTTPDILARLMSQWLSERLGQPFVIENRPGASSNIATESVARWPHAFTDYCAKRNQRHALRKAEFRSRARYRGRVWRHSGPACG